MEAHVHNYKSYQGKNVRCYNILILLIEGLSLWLSGAPRSLMLSGIWHQHSSISHIHIMQHVHARAHTHTPPICV